MGRELAAAFGAARAVYEEVDDALSQKLSGLMFEGPLDELTLTENAQPALMAVSLAALRCLEVEGGARLADWAAMVAGHSLGEYSALAATGALGLADTARLLKRRGQAMQRAVPVGEGAMAALLGLEFDTASDIVEQASEGEICTTANDNAPGQVVISGHRRAVERAIALASEKGARRAIMLPVSAPFHCPLMEPAAREMEEALGEVTLHSPAVPLYANVCAAPVTAVADIRRLLVEQVTGVVRWRESMMAMSAAGADTFVEVGAGRVLSGLTRRINREAASFTVGGPADVESFLKAV